MSALQIWILVPFVAVHCFWVILGLTWVFGELSSVQPVKTMTELKARANQVHHWYLNPFHDRTMTVWKYTAWLTGFAWLATEFFER